MPTTAPVQSPDIDLQRSLGAEGEEDYIRLLRVLRAARGMFALFPVESDFNPTLRAALLERLGADLGKDGMTLHVLKLSRENWNVAECMAREAPGDVLAVVGIEETPGMIQEIGAPVRRPPALSLCNQLREPLRKQVARPMLLWCDPRSYDALLKHAPDFFDHYMGLFHFMDAVPKHHVFTLRDELTLSDNASTQRKVKERTGVSSLTAVELYEELVARRTERTAERGRALLGLAEALYFLNDGDLDARLHRALTAVRDGLQLLSPENSPGDWAWGAFLEGTICSDLPTGDRGLNLQQAIVCFKAALRIYTKDDTPEEWAGTQNNLGNAYLYLPTGERSQNLQRAIACFEAALRVYTEATYPQDWAMIQNNLGNAYSLLSTGDREHNLQQAIACYQAALRVRIKADFPHEWAATQNNLGNAYCNLPVGDRTENLRHAIGCYGAALQIYTEQSSPREWAVTHYNLALALTGQGDHTEARKAMANAAEGFRRIGLEREAQQAEEWLANHSEQTQSEQEASQG